MSGYIPPERRCLYQRRSTSGREIQCPREFQCSCCSKCQPHCEKKPDCRYGPRDDFVIQPKWEGRKEVAEREDAACIREWTCSSDLLMTSNGGFFDGGCPWDIGTEGTAVESVCRCGFPEAGKRADPMDSESWDGSEVHDAGEREEVRLRRKVGETMLVDLIPAGVKMGSESEGCAVFGRDNPTYTSHDLAYARQQARNTVSVGYQMMVVRDRLELRVGRVTRVVRKTSDLFFNPWYHLRKENWPAAIEMGQSVIRDFLRLVNSGTVSVMGRARGRVYVQMDCPIPAPERGDFLGMERERFSKHTFWRSYHAHYRSFVGPSESVREVLVRAEGGEYGPWLVDSDQGRYGADTFQMDEKREKRWELCRIDAAGKTGLRVPLYAYREDLEDETRESLIVDVDELDSKATYLIVGRDAGLAFTRWTDAAFNMRYAVERIECTVGSTNARMPSRWMTRYAMDGLVAREGDEFVEICKLRRKMEASKRTLMECLVNEEFVPELMGEPGKGWFFYRRERLFGETTVDRLSLEVGKGWMIEEVHDGHYVSMLSRRTVKPEFDELVDTGKVGNCGVMRGEGTETTCESNIDQWEEEDPWEELVV